MSYCRKQIVLGLASFLVVVLASQGYAQPCPDRFKTRVVYVNGVNNATFDDALESQVELRGAIRQHLASIGYPVGCVQFATAYNQNEEAYFDFIQAAIQRLSGDTSTLISALLRRLPGPAWFRDDLLAVNAAVFRAFDDLITPELANHVNFYVQELDLDKQVLLIPHSQGNLLANMSYLRVADRVPDNTITRLKLVSVATPAHEVQGGGPWTTLSEDVVISYLATIATVLRPTLEPNITNPAFHCADTGMCHSFVDVYLDGPASGLKILNDITNSIGNINITAHDETFNIQQATATEISSAAILSINGFSDDLHPAVRFLAPLASGMTITPTGLSLDLTTTPNFIGALHVSYLVHTIVGDSNVANITINVTPYLNRPPTAGFSMSVPGQIARDGGTLSVTADSTTNEARVTFTDTSTDPDGDPITSRLWTVNTEPDPLSVGLSSFTWGFTPGGPYIVKLTVTANGGTSSTTGNINVAPAGPVITGISPTTINAGPNDQNVLFLGTGFQQGLTISVGLPGGGTSTLSGTQIETVGPTSISALVTFADVGPYTFTVINPDGRSSTPPFGITVNRVQTTIELLPYQSSGYRYQVIATGAEPPPGFELPSFDDSGWTAGTGAFGSGEPNCSIEATVRTQWPIFTQLLVRHVVNVPAGTTDLNVRFAVDNDVLGVFFNGRLISGPISHENCPNLDDYSIPVPQSVVHAGANLITFHVLDRGSLSFFDARVVALVPLRITSVTPINIFTSPQNQSVMFSGSGFQTGLTISVGLPSGGTLTLSNAQIPNVTATTVEALVTFADPGTYTFVIQNPDGGVSEAFGINVAGVSQSFLIGPPLPTGIFGSPRFGNLAFDANGNVFSPEIFFCGFFYCGDRLVSWRSDGSLRWLSPEDSLLPHDTHPRSPGDILVTPRGRSYFRVQRDTIVAVDESGSNVPGWPVRLDPDGIVGLSIFGHDRSMIIDPEDESVYVNAEMTVGPPQIDFLGAVMSFQPDGSRKWQDVKFRSGVTWIAQGTNRDIYAVTRTGLTSIDPSRLVGLRHESGQQFCESQNVFLSGVLVANDAGTFAVDGGPFGAAGRTLLRFDQSCGMAPVFTTDKAGLAIWEIVGGIVIGADAEDNSGAPESARLVGISVTGSTSWRNNRIRPRSALGFGPARAKLGSTLYVLGEDVVDGTDKAFIVNTSTGEILGSVEQAPLCSDWSTCGIGVAPDATVYVVDKDRAVISKVH